jgi:hypothetical protein
MANCHAANAELVDLMGIAGLAADKIEQHGASISPSSTFNQWC